MTQNILVVEDNLNTQKMLLEALGGQEFSVVVADNGRAALAVLESAEIDLILLDVMMPQMDGYQFIGRVRRKSDVPIIMLTAKRQEHDIVKGFELGADDYLTKPFRMRELLMRIRAVLRRSARSEKSAEQQIIGQMTLDKQHLTVFVGEREVILTPAEFCVLERLAQSADSPVHRANLATYLIQHNFSGSENTLKIHIRNLRQKLGDDSSVSHEIETVFGVGYRLKTNA